MLRDMSQYYQYALNLLARLTDLEYSLGYESLMNFLQEFKRTNNSMALQTNTGLRYASFDNMESVFNRAERYLKKEGSQSERIAFARYWELPEIEGEVKVGFFDNSVVIDDSENPFNLLSESNSRLGIGYNAAFKSNKITLDRNANLAYVRSPNVSRIDIFVEKIDFFQFYIENLEEIQKSLELIQFEGLVSLLIYYQINSHEFVEKISDLTDINIISTKFRDFSANDGFMISEAITELYNKMRKAYAQMSPSSNVSEGNSDEGAYRRKLSMLGLDDGNETIDLWVIGFTIKSYNNNLGQESENYEQYRE